jgi:hypothetical protein
MLNECAEKIDDIGGAASNGWAPPPLVMTMVQEIGEYRWGESAESVVPDFWKSASAVSSEKSTGYQGENWNWWWPIFSHEQFLEP